MARTASWKENIDRYVSGAEEFIDLVVAEAKEPPRSSRARHLAALPLIGSRKGGGKDVPGDIVHALLPALLRKAEEHQIDIALVTYSLADFSAAQAERRKYLPAVDLWPGLSAKAKDAARRLAGKAISGRLVVFLGSGVGVPSGLPLWKELLGQLMELAGLDKAERAALGSWSNLDQAQYLERVLEERGKGIIGKAIAGLITGKRTINLVVSSLANLPTEGFITTNYDELFENACGPLERPVAVLPYGPDRSCTRWLLKMHGCVSHTEDTVLTRRSYNRYAERNQALAGIVQAMLIAREVFFVGFSLGDENFLRIVDAVRQAVAPQERPDGDKQERNRTVLNLGTALLLEPNAMLAQHWKSELDLVCPVENGGDIPASSRSLEIFLDYLLFLSASARHLLERRYDSILNEDEKALAVALTAVRSAAKGLKNRDLAGEVDRLLEPFGGQGFD